MIAKVITTLDELLWYRGAWEEVLENSDTNEPTLSPLWMEAWWQVFGGEEGRELRAVLVFDHGQLVGLAPLVRRRVRAHGVVPLWRMELMASGERQEDETCSDYINILARHGAERAVARAVIDLLVRGSLGPWDDLVLPHMHGGARMTERLIPELTRRYVHAELIERPPCPYAVLPASWEGYLKSLPSKHRYVVKRSLRDLHAWAGTVEMRHAQSPEELEEGLEILVAQHEQRWTSAGRPGVFGSPKFMAFHRKVMAELLRRDLLDLLWLVVDGEPVASIYNIIWNNKVYFYQCGRRMDLPKKLRPGIAMHAHAMQHAIACGRVSYDFLSGASQYKKQLATGFRSFVEVHATRPGSATAALARLTGASKDLARTVRDRIRRRPPESEQAAPSEQDADADTGD